MKKILTTIFILLIGINCVYSKSVKDPKINFNGNKYYLLYSAKTPEGVGYLNEYYKLGETYNIWSEMVAVHQFPNAYYPIDRVKKFREYLATIGCPSALNFNDKKNIAIIDFLLIHQIQGRTLMEFNIFKYEKSKKCGSDALQYARRYVANNAMEVEWVKSDFEKNRKKLIKKVKSYKIPNIITEPIDKCKIEETKENNVINNSATEEVNNEINENINVTENSNISTDKEMSDNDTNNETDKNIVDNEEINQQENEKLNANKEKTDNNTVKEDNNSTQNTVISEPEEHNNANVIENKNEDYNVDNTNIKTNIDNNSKQTNAEDENKKTPEDIKVNKATDSKLSQTSGNKNVKTKQKPQKVKKEKKQKEKSYTVTHEKDAYYYRSDKPRKVNRKKEAKIRAKEAKKHLKEVL